MSTTATGPGPGDSGNNPAPSPATTPGSGTSAEPRFRDGIKPIPTKLTGKQSSLPGVSPDIDTSDDIDAIDSGEQTEQSAQATGPQRGPDGRFLPRDPDAAQAAPDEPVNPNPEEDPNPPAQPQGKIMFMGREFESIAHAEQAHKTMLGRLRAEHERAAQNYTTALAWKNRAEELERELSTRASAPPQPQTAGRPEGVPAGNPADSSRSPEAQAFADSFDWRTYHALQKEDPLAAQYFQMQAYQEFVMNLLDQRLQPLMKPVQEREAQEAFRGQAVEAFSKVAAMEDGEGNPLYPEMADPEARYAIGEIWARSGLDQNAALTPFAITSAILNYRMRAGRQPSPVPTRDPNAAAAQVVQSVAQAPHARGGVVQPPPTPGIRSNGGRVDPVAEYKASFRRDVLGEGNGLAKLPGVSP